MPVIGQAIFPSEREKRSRGLDWRSVWAFLYGVSAYPLTATKHAVPEVRDTGQIVEPVSYLVWLPDYRSNGSVCHDNVLLGAVGGLEG
jgi:hypothetical protein